MSKETRIELNDAAVMDQAVNENICTREDARQFFQRKHEYCMARGIEDYDDFPESSSETMYFSPDEQFLFCYKTTLMSPNTLSKLLRLEYTEQARIGMIEGVSEQDIKRMTRFRTDDARALEEIYDFSLIMYKIGYMYQNGIGFDKDEQAAQVWFDRAYREGWDPYREFEFTKYAPVPMRIHDSKTSDFFDKTTSEDAPCFDERIVSARAVSEKLCSEGEAMLYFQREMEYLTARGIAGYSGTSPEEPSEPLFLGYDELFYFCVKTTPLSIKTIAGLLRLELLEEHRIGITHGNTEDDIEEETAFEEKHLDLLEQKYDFSGIMYKIGYMYENGIGFAADQDTAREWYERARKSGWNDTRTFAFSTYGPSPQRKND